MVSTSITKRKVGDEKPRLTGIGTDDSRRFSGGCLMFYREAWLKFGPPKTILKLISAARIPFNQKPPLILPTSDVMKKFQTPVSVEMTSEIQAMIQNQILEPAPLTPSFISPLFIVTKNNGKNRVIFNLKALNQFMKTRHFHLFHHQQMPNFLQEKDWMTKLDINQAYYHLPITQSQRCFLRISYQGRLLQMTCLPFGLAVAPRMFASVTNWTAEVLRSKGLRLVVYFDDYLIVHQCPKILKTHVQIAIEFLNSLGWNINIEKSILTPTRSIQFLGILWDTKSNTKSLSPDKVNKVRQYLLARLAAGSWTLKQAQRLLGYLNFATFVTLRGRLHCRALQRHSNLLKKNSRRPILYIDEVREELKWWLDKISQKTPIHPRRYPVNYVVTDASNVQWGALVNNNALKGNWSPHQRKWHCNLKEMYAVIAAISSKASVLRDSTVILQTDNRTVVSYIKNEGGTKSQNLLELTKQLLALTDSLNVVLLPHHLPGLYNTEADHLSRNRNGSEWHLLHEATTIVFNLWGTPDVDLFASRDAHVVSKYVTRDLSDSSAYFHDAFSRYWDFGLAWIFPPPALLPRVLQHLNTAQGKFIIMCTQVEETLLAPGPEEPRSYTTYENKEPDNNTSGHKDRSPSGSSSEPTAGSLAHFGWDTLTYNWSIEEKQLLSTCWRASTLKTYTPIWNKWSKWCSQNNLNCRSPAPAEVARYLAKLCLTDRLAYRTILVHKSVIASICETLSDIKISSNHLIRHILKAVSISRPIPPKLPIWDARIVIKFLKNTKPNINSLYDVSRRTATILLLASGRRVHDLTLLHCDSEHFVDSGDTITLYPVFGSKTDSVSYHQSNWTLLNSPDRNTNPLFWLRTLINISQNYRSSLTNLFITTREPRRPATAVIIGGWIRRTLSEAGIEAPPGSFRSAVSSLNSLEKYPINDILAKANWRHENTFRKYYCRDVDNRGRNNEIESEKSLSKYFSATN